MELDKPYMNKITLYTIIFHSFVFMQIFNEINSRKLGAHEFNVFKGFFNNGLFLFIIISTLLVQTALVQYGGAAVRTVPLTLDQHLICLGIGMFSLINGVITKALLKPQWFAWIRIKENATQEEIQSSLSMRVRQPSMMRKSTMKQNALSASKKGNMSQNSGLHEPLVNTAIN